MEFDFDRDLWGVLYGFGKLRLVVAHRLGLRTGRFQRAALKRFDTEYPLF